MPKIDEAPKKKKKGRPTKKDSIITPPVEKIPKKRGRKPKGGKIISNVSQDIVQTAPKPNIILHLKCGKKDLDNNVNNNLYYNPNVQKVESFQFEQNLDFQIISQTNKEDNSESDQESNNEQKILWKRLNELAVNLHTNNISDKRSACFWCTSDFDNPPIYIPQYELNNSYHCYGCFCSPECATAHLFEQNIESAIKFERYHLLNHLYCKIYDYKKNVKPAPNPYYTLDKFYGNLSIQQYRRLLKNERLLLVVDKPLTRIMPELHEDNDDLILNNKSIPSANYTLKTRRKQTKKGILAENFNLK